MAVTYVITGTCREFECWCRENMVSTHSPLVCYIGEGESYKLQGLRNPSIVVYGNYHDRPDFRSLESMVRAISRPPEPKIVYIERDPPKKEVDQSSYQPGRRIVNWES